MTVGITVDDALKLVGGYRRWHVTSLVLISFTTCMTIAFQTLSIIFIGWTPPYHCSPEVDISNDTFTQVELGQCDRTYVISQNGTWLNETRQCENGWTYDKTYTTMVTDWDLVCSNNYLAELSQTLYNVASLVSTVAVAYAVDRFGRKRVHVIAAVLVAICGAIASYLPTFTAFAIFRCVISGLVRATSHSGVVMIIEMFDSTRRTAVGVWFEYAWVASCVLLTPLAYAISSWRILYLVTSLGSALALLHIWFLLESPRWLAANNRHAEAEEVLLKMAKWNRVDVDQITLLRQEQAEKSVTKISPTVLVTDRYLRVHVLINALLWFTNMLVYYGIAYLTPSIGTDRFIGYFVMSIVEVPAYTFSLPLVNRLGRRRLLCALHVLIGPPLVILALIPSHSEALGDLTWVKLVMAMIGKLGIAASFTIMIIFTTELFPTTIRTTSLGVCQLAAAVGGMIAPFANFAGKLGMAWLPNLVFAGLTVFTGIAVLLLPETTNVPLADTIQDIHNLYRYGRSGKMKKSDREVNRDEGEELMDAVKILKDQIGKPLDCRKT